VPQWLNSLNGGGVVGSSASSSSKASSSSAAVSSVATSSTASSTATSSTPASSAASVASSVASVASSASNSSAAASGWIGSALVLGQSTTTITGALNSSTNSTVNFSAALGKFESAKDAFYFVGKDVTGDFTFIANLSQMTSALKVSSSDQYRVGIMLCTDCSTTAASANAQIGLSSPTLATETVIVNSHRLVAGGSVNKEHLSVVASAGASLYFKIVRVGSIYTSYYSTDGGLNYVQGRTGDFSTAIGSTAKIGFFAAPGDAATNTIGFADISLTQ
jgi:hypothetical protein